MQIIEARDIPGFTILNFGKNTFSIYSFKILVLYRKRSIHLSEFKMALRYLIGSEDIDIILGDFNINAFETLPNDLLFLSEKYEMIVQEPTHISGSIIDHVYIRKIFKNQFNISCLVKNIYFSDPDAVRLMFTC